jgi:hypothetical protein
MNIISGEKIQNLCDYYLGTQDHFNYNPFIKSQPHKHLNIDSLDIVNQIANAKISNLFCYLPVLETHLPVLVNVLSHIKTPFNLCFHNGDTAFTQEHSNVLLKNDNILCIYSQNLSISPHDRLKPLPIGIANSMWLHGNIYTWASRLQMSLPKKQHLIYFYFDINTNTDKRQTCFDIIRAKGVEYQAKKSLSDYIQTLSTFKFAICPEGNGMDTHRFWECLYLKVIPICPRNIITEYYSKIFPVVLLDKWKDLNIDDISAFYETCAWTNYDKLFDITDWINLTLPKKYHLVQSVTLFGTCRINNVKHNNNLNNLTTYTHSTKEVIQLIHFLKGELNIPVPYNRLCFRAAIVKYNETGGRVCYSDANKQRFLSTDVFVVEICSNKKYMHNNFYLHHIYVDNQHPDWHMLTPVEILNNHTIEIQTDEEIENDMLEIQKLLYPKKMIVVSHLDLKLNGEYITSRRNLINLLDRICKKYNISFINPMKVLSNFSQECLVDKDLAHYTERGINEFSKYVDNYIK